MNSIPTTDGLWTSCLNALRQICGDQATLPTTHILSHTSIERGNNPIAVHDTDSFWEAQYKRRAVRVRSLQAPLASERALRKVLPPLPPQYVLYLHIAKILCHEVVLWRRLIHPNIALVLGLTMDPYQIVFDQVSNKDVMQYTLREGVDRVNLVSSILSSNRD